MHTYRWRVDAPSHIFPLLKWTDKMKLLPHISGSGTAYSLALYQLPRWDGGQGAQPYPASQRNGEERMVFEN